VVSRGVQEHNASFANGSASPVRVGPCNSYRLCHTFATNYLRQAGDIVRLSMVLGHTQITTTQRYLITEPLASWAARRPGKPCSARFWIQRRARPGFFAFRVDMRPSRVTVLRGSFRENWFGIRGILSGGTV